MPVIRIETVVDAAPSTCFDLARSVEAHLATTGHTRERAVDGVVSGLLGLGDTVTWEARHFGITQRLTSRIVTFDRPHHFCDEMVRGAFDHLRHDHHFQPHRQGTLMIDVLDFAAPFGLVGRLAEHLFLTAYMRRFLQQRGSALATLARNPGGFLSEQIAPLDISHPTS